MIWGKQNEAHSLSDKIMNLVPRPPRDVFSPFFTDPVKNMNPTVNNKKTHPPVFQPFVIPVFFKSGEKISWYFQKRIISRKKLNIGKNPPFWKIQKFSFMDIKSRKRIYIYIDPFFWFIDIKRNLLNENATYSNLNQPKSKPCITKRFGNSPLVIYNNQPKYLSDFWKFRTRLWIKWEVLLTLILILDIVHSSTSNWYSKTFHSIFDMLKDQGLGCQLTFMRI